MVVCWTNPAKNPSQAEILIEIFVPEMPHNKYSTSAQQFTAIELASLTRQPG
jgi:hypothetical protein